MIIELMKSRRSVRRFSPERPPRDRIERLLEAAVAAPSASNKQPWRFVIVTRRATIESLASAVREATDRIARHIEPACESAFRAYGDYFTRFEGAPVVVAFLFRKLSVLSNLLDGKIGEEDRERIGRMERDSGLMGTAMALENFLLAAHEAGLGASGMTGPLVAADRLRTILEIPPSWEIAALAPVGFPAEVPAPTERKPARGVTRWID